MNLGKTSPICAMSVLVSVCIYFQYCLEDFVSGERYLLSLYPFTVFIELCMLCALFDHNVICLNYAHTTLVEQPCLPMS